MPKFQRAVNSNPKFKEAMKKYIASLSDSKRNALKNETEEIASWLRSHAFEISQAARASEMHEMYAWWFHMRRTGFGEPDVFFVGDMNIDNHKKFPKNVVQGSEKYKEVRAIQLAESAREVETFLGNPHPELEVFFHLYRAAFDLRPVQENCNDPDKCIPPVRNMVTLNTTFQGGKRIHIRHQSGRSKTF